MTSAPTKSPVTAISTYSETAQMLRHYSSMRGTLVAFLVSVAVALGGWAFENSSRPALALYLVGCEALISGFAAFVCLYFSSNINRARGILIRVEDGQSLALFKIMDSDSVWKYVRMDVFDRMIIFGIITIHVGFAIYAMTLSGIVQW